MSLTGKVMLRQVFIKAVRTSFPEIEINDMGQRREAIFPTHLFSFKVSAWKVGDGQFHDAESQPRDLCCYFRLEAKAIGFQFDILDHIRAEKLVAGFHVGQIQTAQEIAAHGKNTIHQIMKCYVNLITRLLESRTIDDVCLPLEQWTNQRANVVTIGLQIGVLNANEVPSRPSN